jgi:DnaK suppressor protein
MLQPERLWRGGAVKRLSEAFILECKRRLLDTKREILDRVRNSRIEFQMLDKAGGDEADQTMSLLAENDYLTNQMRLKEQLLEIELALARIEKGSYGICEETEEPIESERLRALPWTRLSIEGAEIREAMRRRFAR